MRRAVLNAAGVSLLLAGTCFGPRSSCAAAASMTPSQCVTSMVTLEREIISLTAQITACKEGAACLQLRKKLNRTMQKLNSTKRLCTAVTSVPAASPGRSAAPVNAGGPAPASPQPGPAPDFGASADPRPAGSPVQGSLPLPAQEAKGGDDSGGGWGGFFSRIGDVGKTIFNTGKGIIGDIVGTLIDVPVGLVKDLGSAGKSLLRGDFLGALKGVGGAVVNAVGRTAGGVVDILGKTLLGGVDIVDRLILGKSLPRPLTAEENALLNSVYKGSVNLGAVRICIGSSSHLALPAHAISNYIYFPQPLGPLKNADGTLTWDGQTLIHETGHVWQSQHGGGDYLHKAMFANMKYAIMEGDRNKAYEWKPQAAQGVPFASLNPEQQATVIDNLAADELRPEGKKWLTDVETAYARAAMQLVYAGKGAP